MIAAERTLLVLLAAGRSERFGEEDKLAETWRGVPLAMHVVTAMAEIAFLDRVAIVSDTALDFAPHGYRMIDNPAPETGLSGSVRLGVAAAQQAGAAALLIVLADMPCVTAALIGALLAAAEGPAAVVAASDGTRPSPPALFGAGRFDQLARAGGDAGGRALIRDGLHIITDAEDLIDIDTAADLERLRSRA